MLNEARKIVFGSLMIVLLLPGCSLGEVDGDIRISSISTEDRSIRIEVTAWNMGTDSHEFPIGCSLKRQDNTWLDIRYQIHKIARRENITVIFESGPIELGEFFLVRAAIWKGEEADGTLNTRLAMDERPMIEREQAMKNE